MMFIKLQVLLHVMRNMLSYLVESPEGDVFRVSKVTRKRSQEMIINVFIGISKNDFT